MDRDLDDLKGVGPSTVETLNSVGVSDIEELAKVDVSEANLDGHSMTEDRLEELSEKANKNTITIETGDEVYDKYDNRDRLSTGVPELDSEIGGGIEERGIVAVGGPTGSGKTQISFQLASEAVEATGDPAVYIETEPDRYRGERIREMYDTSVQEDVHKIEVRNPNPLDKQYYAYKAVQENYDDVSAVIVDSFTSRFRMEGDFTGRENFGSRGEEFRRHLNAIEEMAQEMQCPVILVCQVYQNPGQYGSQYTIYGSTFMMHMVNFVMMMKDRSGALTQVQLKNDSEMGDVEMLLQINEDGLEFAE